MSCPTHAQKLIYLNLLIERMEKYPTAVDAIKEFKEKGSLGDLPDLTGKVVGILGEDEEAQKFHSRAIIDAWKMVPE